MARLPSPYPTSFCAIFQAFASFSTQWGTIHLFIANFVAVQIIGGAKELVVLL